MSKKMISGFILLASLTILSEFAVAEDAPTLHQVYQQAQSGKLDEAQKMMEKVLQAHPDSSKAHFVEAELLARQGRMAQAETELNTAEKLEPGLPFAKVQSVQQLKEKIAGARQQHQSMMKSAPTEPAAGFPWGWLLLGIGSIGLITMLMRNRSRDTAGMAGGAYRTAAPAQPYAGGNGMPVPAAQPAWGNNPAPAPAPASGGIGSSIMSGLATGAAVGAGIVAGEALAHHFMDGNRNEASPVSPVADSWNSSSDNMGGADFGIADNGSWNDNANLADSMDVGGDDWS